MPRLVRFALLSALVAAFTAGPAQASRVLGLPETMTTAHFQLHYDGAVVHQQAGDLAGNFERAYTTFASQWGYPAPLDDGDGKIDVYILDVGPGVLGAAFPDNPAASQTSGYIYIDDEAVAMPETAAHELFHLVQLGIWQPMDIWVLEASAEWASFRFLDFPLTVGDELPLATTLGAPDMSLTCPAWNLSCGWTAYEIGGYSRWHFYQYLTERFGNSAVKDIFDKAKALNDTTLTGGDILISAMTAKGATLSDVFTDWTVANMQGNYAARGLKGIQPVPLSSTATGIDSGTLPAQTVAVNHLAARYIGFTRGSGTVNGACHPATLTLNVSFPTGLGARPYFHWTEPLPVPTTATGTATEPPPRAAPIPLAVSGSNATISVPWDTCAWDYTGLLSLPNPTTNVDAALFTVTGTITVDKTRVGTSTPPAEGTYTGPTVPAPSGEPAPSIALYGPETLRVSRKKRLVRLVVFSSGGGRLDAQLGATSLGSRTLRAGNNDLRYTLPRGLVRSLSARNLLTLTSVSSSGAHGASLTRKLVLTK